VTAGKFDERLIESGRQRRGSSARSAFRSGSSTGGQDPGRRRLQRGDIETVAANGRGVLCEEEDKIGLPRRRRWREEGIGFAVVVINGCELHKPLEGGGGAVPLERVLCLFLSPHRTIAFNARQEFPGGRLVRNKGRGPAQDGGRRGRGQSKRRCCCQAPMQARLVNAANRQWASSLCVPRVRLSTGPSIVLRDNPRRS
jgi:hypothetical protein